MYTVKLTVFMPLKQKLIDSCMFDVCILQVRFRITPQSHTQITKHRNVIYQSMTVSYRQLVLTERYVPTTSKIDPMVVCIMFCVGQNYIIQLT